MDDRAVTPVVEKTITVGLVVLFVAGFAGSLLGGAVPDYRTSAGQEVADRVLSSAASAIEEAPPATNATVRVRTERSLPPSIRGQAYDLVLRNRTLRLRHPDPQIGGTTRLGIPNSVTVRNGTWDSPPLVVRVRGPVENRTLAIAEGDS